jgi:hypothetical protein
LSIITRTLPEYEKFLKDNLEISDLKEFFSDYIQTILSEKLEKDPNKKIVTKEELELIGLY